MPTVNCDIKDIPLSGKGVARIERALNKIPLLRKLMECFARERSMEGICISGCLHITTETANLARVLVSGGADLVLCASTPLSTQDDGANLVNKMQKKPPRDARLHGGWNRRDNNRGHPITGNSE